MYGEELCRAFGEVKALWDPEGRMNPGKVADPYPITSNLRLGEDYDPWEPETRFRYPTTTATSRARPLRCVGVGKCRRHEGGVMCPSYMATREERHSTRGRARLLFEMLQGEAIADGWRSDAVRESLDLCLACKGCKSDCPVNVDMATYKAEFLHHHYRGRRPRAAYAMGLIDWWSRLAARARGSPTRWPTRPSLAGLLQGARRHRPGAADAGLRRRRRSGPGSREQPARTAGGPRVLLWPDTFNNFFHPEVARAAVEVLEAAGFDVELPPRILCCGRPLYDYGMLDLAERQLRQIVDTLRDDIRAGVPLVGLEPSCVAAFRDELPQPDAARRRRAAPAAARPTPWPSCWTPKARTSSSRPPSSGRRSSTATATTARSCTDADEALLDRLGLDYGARLRLLRHGRLLRLRAGREVRGLDRRRRARAAARGPPGGGTLVLADGFSCRSQIEQTTDRRALHLAQVLRRALRAG